MKRLVGVSCLLLLLAAGILGALFYFGLWSPNAWVARAYPIQGIDVSNHQGAIDWAKVAGSGIAFAYIKATEGEDFRDRSFAENWKESAKHGVVRGAYHYFTMQSSGKEQAENFIAAVPVDPKALPPVIDLEFVGNGKDRRSVSSFRKELEDFLSLLRMTYGKEPVIYTDDDFSGRYLTGYSIKRRWVPSFFTVPRPQAKAEWIFWQFSERGRVPGILTYVDRDVFAGDAGALRALVVKEKTVPRT